VSRGAGLPFLILNSPPNPQQQQQQKMILHNLIGLAGTIALIHGLAFSLGGHNHILTDLILDWQLPFKTTRKDKVAKAGKDGQ
jgi:hypothetical protein